MGYDMTFRNGRKVVDDFHANITWNVREIVAKSSGWEILNEQSNGLVRDIIPKIQDGLVKLQSNKEEYRKYEPTNKYGTVEDVIELYQKILTGWKNLLERNSNYASIVELYVD